MSSTQILPDSVGLLQDSLRFFEILFLNLWAKLPGEMAPINSNQVSIQSDDWMLTRVYKHHPLRIHIHFTLDSLAFSWIHSDSRGFARIHLDSSAFFRVLSDSSR